jgi:hypothetical protein
VRFAATLCVGIVAFVGAAGWVNPALGLVAVPLIYVVAFVSLRVMDRRTARSIEANVADALARRDRLLGRR